MNPKNHSPRERSGKVNGPSMTYEERMLYITRNLVSYKEYDNDVLKACKVLRKYFKEKSIDECRKDLERTVEIYQEGIQFVQTYKGEYSKSKESRTSILEKAENEFTDNHPEIQKDLLKYILLEIFNWYHER